MRARNLALILAATCAAAIVLVVAHQSGTLVPLDDWGDEHLKQPLGHYSGSAVTVHRIDGTGNMSYQGTSNTTDFMVGPTNETQFVMGGGFWIPDAWWVEKASSLGSPSGALVFAILTAAVLARQRAWRALAIGLATMVIVGAVVDPLQAALNPGCSPCPNHSAAPVIFPSGHTIGATMGAGLLFLLPGQVRVRLALPVRWPLRIGGWLAVAGAVGIDRVLSGHHAVGDVLAGWAIGASVVLVALLADRWWANPAVRTPS
jgi:membrane-associated phospholipid phosphatase